FSRPIPTLPPSRIASISKLNIPHVESMPVPSSLQLPLPQTFIFVSCFLLSTFFCLFAGRDGMTIFGQRQTPKKRRKSRTAFTNHQIYELEKRFLYQKYLSPADRDQIAQQLGLTNAQVITWFQNRRAKLKRDLEEMKADVESAKKLAPGSQAKLVALVELEHSPEGPAARSPSLSPSALPAQGLREGSGTLRRPSPPSPPLTDPPGSSQDCSEDEDVEIDVDD
uniref:Ladybird homeobox 1 n=1 Tax=Anolis carolinensis TaxID=28377 RepID=H9GH94_ANOCA